MSFNSGFNTWSSSENINVKNSNFPEEFHAPVKDKYLSEVDKEKPLSSLQINSDEDVPNIYNIQEIFNEVVNKLNTYFNDLNIEIKYLPILFSNNTSTINAGLTRPNHIEISDIEVSNTIMKYLLFIRTMTHELYHSTGTLNIYPTINDEEVLNIETLRHGACFSNRNANAVEEGMADLMEQKIFDEIKYLFPTEVIDIYNNIINKILLFYDDRGEGENVDDQSILITKLDDRVNFMKTEYKWSKELVNYLSNEIHNFNFLLEDMRVNGKKLPLARAIEERFGRGYFKKIFELSANNEDAKYILEELQSL